MKILNETELMHNQKASTVIMPDKQFEAVQTIEGYSLLFTLDDDKKILNCNREVPGDVHGWIQVDLSSSLSQSCYQGAPVAVKTFDIAQDMCEANTIDIAMVVTVSGNDFLHIVTGFENTFDNWTSNAPVFDQTTQYKFDYPGNNIATCQAMPINDVQILDSNDGNAMQYIIVDLISDASAQTLSRFYIDVTKQHGYVWLPHNLQATLDAGKVTSYLGCGPGDGPNGTYNVGGVYVLGTVDSKAQLFYTPSCNYLHPEEHAESTVFNLPEEYNSEYMAMALSAPAATAPYTDIFFVSNYTDASGVLQGGLYFLANADQTDTETTNATPKLIYTHDLLRNIQSIRVKNWNDNIVLWGQSYYNDSDQTPATGSQLFIMEGVAGQETNADAWSVPISLLLNVENSSAFVNNNYSLDSAIDSTNGNAYGSCNVLFAHQADGNLVQLFQDPVTSAWQERFLLMEPLDALTEMYETVSYTSHISIADDNNVVQPGIAVSIWSSSPTSAYVNNVYSTLDFTAPLQTTADEIGVINITQPVDSIGGICYNIAVQDPNTHQWFTQVVNPLAVTNANLAKQVPDDKKDYLQGKQVTAEDGSTSPLVSSNFNDQTASTSNNIYSFNQHNTSLNQDGLTDDQEKAGGWPKPGISSAQIKTASAAARTLKGTARRNVTGTGKKRVKRFAKADRLARDIRFNPKTDKIWGCTFGKNARHFQGIEAIKEMGIVVQADGSLHMATAAGGLGSIFSALESKAGHLFKWLQSEAHKLESAIIKLAEDGLDCLLTIAGKVYHFVVKCMNDISNAIHTVLNAIKTAFEDLVKWIGSLFAWHDFIATHSVIKNLFVQYGQHCIDNIDSAIDGVTGLVDNVMGAIDKWAGLPEDSSQSQSKGQSQDSGQHKPQNNWAQHHVKNNADNISFSLSASEFGSAIQTLMDAVSKEGEILSGTLAKLKSIDISTISMSDLIKEIVAILADEVLQSVENIVTTFLTVVKDIIQGTMDMLTKEVIKIPVISALYERFVGSPLTLLDVVCLVAAIPVTVIYKMLNGGTAPFPAGDPDTIALSGATDYASLCQLCHDQSAVKAVAPGLLGDASWAPPPLNDRWYKLFFAGNVMACFGGVFIGVLGYMKTKNSSSKTLATLYALTYLPYIGPDIVGNVPGMIQKDSRWFSVLNSSLSIAGVAKAFWDIRYASAPEDPAAPIAPGWFGNAAGLTGYGFLSPFIDAILNGVWELPTVEAFTHSEKNINDIVSLVANTLFNASGIISPLVTFSIPPGQPFWLVLQTGLNICYGAGSLAVSVDGQPIDPISV